jgi:hypothetical protein
VYGVRGPVLTAIEKVGDSRLRRNNPIGGANSLDRNCAVGRRFETISLRDPLKILFNSIDPTRTLPLSQLTLPDSLSSRGANAAGTTSRKLEVSSPGARQLRAFVAC